MKFFKTGNVNSYDLYVCEDTTPIPTIAEVIERFEMHPGCIFDSVTEITHEEFLRLHHELLKEVTGTYQAVEEWAPNCGDLNTWRIWFSEEEQKLMD